MNVASQKFVVGRWIYIILERICVCTKSIITNIRQITNRKLLVIDQ